MREPHLTEVKERDAGYAVLREDSDELVGVSPRATRELWPRMGAHTNTEV